MTRETDRGLTLGQTVKCGVVPGKMVSFLAESKATPDRALCLFASTSERSERNAFDSTTGASAELL